MVEPEGKLKKETGKFNSVFFASYPSGIRVVHLEKGCVGENSNKDTPSWK